MYMGRLVCRPYRNIANLVGRVLCPPLCSLV